MTQAILIDHTEILELHGSDITELYLRIDRLAERVATVATLQGQRLNRLERRPRWLRLLDQIVQQAGP